MGKCPKCASWSTLEEVIEEPEPKAGLKSGGNSHRALPEAMRTAPLRLREVSTEQGERIAVPVQELSRVLGGGIVPGSIMLLGGEPGIGKCVTADTRVFDPSTGDYLPITAWANSDRHVLSVDTDSLELNNDRVLALLERGTYPIVTVETRLGRRLNCTPDHPVLTHEGWRPVGSLKPGDSIAAPRALPYFGNEVMSDAELDACIQMSITQQVVPSQIFRLPAEQMSMFLQRVVAGNLVIECNNFRFVADLQHLMLRFGLIASIGRSGDSLGFVLKIAETESAAVATNRELVGINQRLQYVSNLQTYEVIEYAGDVYWDEINSITPAGEAPVYDLSVNNNHNFVANDLIIHNSTLLLQVAIVLAQSAGKVLYVSGEESTRQIKMRAERLNLNAEDLYLVTETSLESILEHAQNLQPSVMIVDSIQTTYSDDKPSSAGTVSQIRECAARLQMLAKTTGISIFLVGHVTKEGTIAGPRVLEHIVDTVLYLEGDPFHAYRLLRSVKNRFGATNEIGVFEMRESGMVEVTNPSEAFLAERMQNSSGSGVVVTMEGTRPLVVEVQALVSPTSYPNPRRTGNGVDFNRLQLVAAVLMRRLNLRLSEQDIFINVVGGITIDEPAADMAMALAIASSMWDRAIPPDMAIIGELGLSGELRSVGQLAARMREAAKLGFKRCLIPRGGRGGDPLPKEIEALPVRSLLEAIRIAIPGDKKPVRQEAAGEE